MKTPHLVPACVAILILIAVLIGGMAYAQSLEQRYVHALAGQLVTMNSKSGALQKSAFQQPDLLPIYGSSEIYLHVAGYEASDIFRKYPTGFTPFEVARNAATSLIMAQELASVGPDLQGKKVVISFTPSMFVNKIIAPNVYDGLFSRLHANELVFNTRLDFAVKQAAAQRMLQYPDTLEQEPLLSFALQTLAEDSPLNRVLYYAVWPLGKLQTTIVELQDHWNTLAYFAAHPKLKLNPPRRPGSIDWPALQAAAQQLEISDTTSNPYGILNSTWLNSGQPRLPQPALFKTGADHDQIYLDALTNSVEWTDLDILLRILTQLGAQPLLLSRPINGTLWQALGVSAATRQVYYDRLSSIGAKYGVPVVDFQSHDTDKYFSVDGSSHPSPLGWVYVDQVLDEFYHGTLR